MKKITIVMASISLILILAFYYIDNSTTSSNNKNNTTNQVVENQISDNLVYNGKFPIPVENFIKVTSKFGYREASGVVHSNHTGIDLVGTKNSNIVCVKEGEVTWAGWQSGYGNCVEVKHIDESGTIFYSFYAHMQDNSLKVTKGDKVVLGQVVGTQGSTGNSTGDHLHFEIRLADKTKVDPAPYLFNEV